MLMFLLYFVWCLTDVPLWGIFWKHYFKVFKVSFLRWLPFVSLNQFSFIVDSISDAFEKQYCTSSDMRVMICWLLSFNIFNIFWVIYLDNTFRWCSWYT